MISARTAIIRALQTTQLDEMGGHPIAIALIW